MTAPPPLRRTGLLALAWLLAALALGACATREPFLRIDAQRTGDALAVGWPTLRAVDGGPEVVLVNTVHLGELGFYEHVQRALDTSPVVFLEGVQGDSAAIDDMMASYGKLADTLGLVTQRAHLIRRPDWHLPDVDASEIEAALVHHPFKLRMAVGLFENHVDERMEELARRHPDMADEEQRRRAHQSGRRLLAEALVEATDPDPVLIVRRNQHLMDAVLGFVAEHPGVPRIAICYGASHAEGLIASLERHGYEVSGTTWRHVFAVGQAR